MRDPAAGLELRAAGPRHVDGDTALAMVRSRHPEELVAGHWSPAAVDPDGRATAAARVLDALADAVRARPWRAQQVAWAASDALAVDTGTSPGVLSGLLTADLGRPVVLPVADPPEGTWARFPTPVSASTRRPSLVGCRRAKAGRMAV